MRRHVEVFFAHTYDHALILAFLGSYMGASDTVAGCRTPATSTSQFPLSKYFFVRGASPRPTYRIFISSHSFIY